MRIFGIVALAFAVAAISVTPPIAAQEVIAQPPPRARTILFVGNSFTFGANSPVRAYRPDLVNDLNGDGVGGVPALFKTFADEAHVPFAVALETDGGKDLQFHYENRQRQLAGTYDVVILQGLSTLAARPQGDAAAHIAYAGKLAAMFKARNPSASIALVSTWSRADLTYRPGSRWSGKPITAMALDLRAANEAAITRAGGTITAQIPVGEAWSRAFAQGVADPNPYDGIRFGEVDLWTWDQFHASAAGYYLEALMIFGQVTGKEPTILGADERAANALGLEPTLAARLQRIAAEQLAASSRK